ncbi:hypothetical protein [Methanococcoides methylutens]|uniref:hypothetical protein n=1 Tax=Methanococcoides methylutens TaxID=2226 RepID=UPI00143838C9|nr:hypothetical protein [Methanococcoides methylutens]
MKKITVKARSRQGTKSLDLTIPVKIVEDANIKEGDIFTVEKSKIGENIILTYSLVYKQ